MICLQRQIDELDYNSAQVKHSYCFCWVIKNSKAYINLKYKNSLILINGKKTLNTFWAIPQGKKERSLK